MNARLALITFLDGHDGHPDHTLPTPPAPVDPGFGVRVPRGPRLRTPVVGAS
jgi:hypothetical protein